MHVAILKFLQADHTVLKKKKRKSKTDSVCV